MGGGGGLWLYLDDNLFLVCLEICNPSNLLGDLNHTLDKV